MKFNREWAMPSHETFTIPPIAAFVDKYIRESTISIDPFARDFTRATHTNDLNPDTLAGNHFYAIDFLKLLYEKDIKADLVIFDPPYNINQVKTCYNKFGIDIKQEDAQKICSWVPEKLIINNLLKVNGVFLHFGWHTNGMGKNRAYHIEEILLVAHGGPHYDTICMAERKLQHQETLFSAGPEL